MKYVGRIAAILVVIVFNVLRYFYYHYYLGLPFKANFFILTIIFLAIAAWCGKQYDLVKYYSEKDPLTDTFNRRTVEQHFKNFLKDCKKENKKLAVIMMDLNKFKEINDTYGHNKGDELLSHFAYLIKKSVKNNDVVARWGGDEFLILVPDSKDDFESIYIQELQQKLASENFEKFSSVGVSLGFAIYPDDGQSLQELIQKADGAMYKAKGA
ncbi:GGDEF domain-containing protein [Sporosarcina sp. YIM B06819]|uniref:GGDEF domain-containing protein n=1 Tax=Sporosarcina sp. YIM B06819 TaxID=3081769 RepID=UPI00298BE83F|nr:GGDEF domain-containing protein [Sporosarcina sp. YIM B06819]